MSLSIKLVVFFLMLNFNSVLSQQYIKQTIYLSFDSEIKDCPYENLKFKMKKPNGIQFNLCGNAVLLYSLSDRIDTLEEKQLGRYKISSTQDVAKKVQEFKNKYWKKKPLTENHKLYQFYDNNDIFETFLIVKLCENEYAVYPVFWKSQRLEK